MGKNPCKQQGITTMDEFEDASMMTMSGKSGTGLHEGLLKAEMKIVDMKMGSSNEEELPFFREAHQELPQKQKTLPSPVVDSWKPGMMMLEKDGVLMRGGSLSSTTGTETESEAMRLSISNKGDCSVRMAEPARDGDWLQQLQYKLYSREHEETILLKTYLNRRRQSAFRKSANAADLCLISGSAGLGKTRLARTLETTVKDDGGYFLSAKYDQVKQARPTRIFVDAFTEFTYAVLAQGPEMVKSVRLAILEAVGDELSVIMSAIPALERIVGSTNLETVQMSCAMAKRLVFALQDLIGAVCTAETPMILLFDDLQWADPCSLKLLKSFIMLNQNRHLFLIGTCDDSVAPDSPVSNMLRELESENSRSICNIEVSQKPCSFVREVIMETLPMPKERHDSLAKLVCSQTQGNPLYILEFLRWLWDEQLLQYDAANGTWMLHDKDARLTVKSCLGEFLIDKLEQFPKDLQEVIRVAACFGNEVNEKLMSVVFPSDAVNDKLHEATSRGVFVYDQDLGFAFRHDGLQKAALALVPPEDQESMHLRLGRKLLKGLNEDDRKKNIDLILGQLRLGKRFITDAEEREVVAMFALTAGKASARASAFGVAAGYFQFGIDLLRDSSWKGDYSLTLALYNAAAEMQLTLSNYERVHELLQVVFDKAPRFKDKIQSYNTQIYAFGVTDQQDLAVNTGIKVLKELGEEFPIKHCNARLRGEMRKVKGLLRGMSNARILRMENISNYEKLEALQLLNIMFLNAMLVRPKFAPFIQLKSVEITMRYGLSALSSIAFASYAMLCTSLGKYDDGQRYGQLALDLLKKFRSKEYAPRVFAAVYGCVIPWQRPIQESIEPLKKAQLIGSQTGDIEFACFNASMYASAVFFSDKSLPVVSSQIETITTMMTVRRQDSLLVLTKPFLHLSKILMGLTDSPLTLSSVNGSDGNVTSLLCVRLHRLMLDYLLGDYESAGVVSGEIELSAFATPGIEQIFCKFFIGMTHLATARIFQGFQKHKCARKAKAAIKQFRIWSLHSPHNCLPMKYLLEAEMASFAGANKKAYGKYTAASALAVDGGFRMIEAMSHEHAGRHLYSIGEDTLAAASFRKALACYEDWGAKAKHSHLKREVSKMMAKSSITLNADLVAASSMHF